MSPGASWATAARRCTDVAPTLRSEPSVGGISWVFGSAFFGCHRPAFCGTGPDRYHEILHHVGFVVKKTPDYRGIAKVFWSGRSQAVRLPAACRFETSEVEVIKEGDQLTLRPRGKHWATYFDSRSRGSLPQRHQPPLDARDEMK